MKVTWGEYEYDTDKMPEKSTAILLRAAIGHKLSNEASSAVVSHFRQKAAEGLEGEAAKKAREDAVIPDSDSDAYKAVKADAQTEIWKRISEGTLGESTRGPARDPAEVIRDAYIKGQVIAWLRAKNAWKGSKHPTAETVWKINNVERTFTSLCEGYAAKHSAEVEKHVKAKLAEQARLAKQVESLEDF